MFIPRFLFFYLFVVLVFSFYLEQVVINSRYLNDKFSFSVPSLPSSLLTLRFFWTISFSPKTSVSIWQLMPLILSSLTCSLSQELLIYICGEHPMGMLYPASFEIKFLILLPKPALALYSNPSGLYPYLPRWPSAKWGGFPLLPFPICLQVCLFFLLNFSLTCAPTFILSAMAWAPCKWLGSSLSYHLVLYLLSVTYFYLAAGVAHSLDYAIIDQRL